MLEVEIRIRPATPEDELRLDAIRVGAFASVFSSFRSLLGDELYELAQAGDDAAQKALLSSMLVPGSPWELYVAEADAIVGFVSVRLE